MSLHGGKLSWSVIEFNLMSSGLHPFEHEPIIKEAERIRDDINNRGFFRQGQLDLVNHSTIENNTHTLSILYRYMDDDTFCKAVYTNEIQPSIDTTPKPVRTVVITWVGSSISGFGVGSFLLYVQLLLAYRVGASVVKLNNSAGNTPENAVRALHGIYKLFNFNSQMVNRANRIRYRRIESNQTLTNNEKKSRILQEVAGGDLYLDMKKFNYLTLTNYLTELRTREDEPESPWVPDVKDRFRAFALSSSESRSGKAPSKRHKQETPYSRPIKGGKRTRKMRKIKRRTATAVTKGLKTNKNK